MDKNKIMILALIVIIAALLVGLVAMMSNTNKQDTKLTFKGDSTITEGESIKIKLTDDNGTALVNQTVKITFNDKDNSTSDYSVVTNDEGIGKLKLDKNAGEYNVTISYEGNDSYNGCNTTKKITIEEEVVETQTSYTNSYTNSYSQKYTTDEHGVYDNEHGVYITGQAEGLSKEELAEIEAKIERDGGMI